MTLREELEKKLRDLYFSADSDVFGLIADEVIRQMEWARGLYMKSEGIGPIKVVPETSLAPDEWKP